MQAPLPHLGTPSAVLGSGGVQKPHHGLLKATLAGALAVQPQVRTKGSQQAEAGRVIYHYTMG